MGTRRPRPDEQTYTVLEQTPIRSAIGARTRQSMQEKPHFWMSTEVDATAIITARAGLRAAEAAVVPSLNDYILRTVALVLRENPRFNAWVADDGLHVLDHVNVGFAVATDRGVLMPTLMDADLKPLAQTAVETRELVELARTGKLRASLQMGAGFSISNIGRSEVDAFNAIISPPQTGILAIGAIKSRPLVIAEELVVRKTMICTLSIDHAAADGADGAKLLDDLKHRLESPDSVAGL